MMGMFIGSFNCRKYNGQLLLLEKFDDLLHQTFTNAFMSAGWMDGEPKNVPHLLSAWLQDAPIYEAHHVGIFLRDERLGKRLEAHVRILGIDRTKGEGQDLFDNIPVLIHRFTEDRVFSTPT